MNKLQVTYAENNTCEHFTITEHNKRAFSSLTYAVTILVNPPTNLQLS